MRQIGAGAYCGAAVVLIAGSFLFWMYEWYTAGHTKWVSASAWSADGKRLITAAGDDQETEVLVWDIYAESLLRKRFFEVGRPIWLKPFGDEQEFLLLSEGKGVNWDDYSPPTLSRFSLDDDGPSSSRRIGDFLGHLILLNQSNQIVEQGSHKILLQSSVEDAGTSLFENRDLYLRDIGISENEKRLAATTKGKVFLFDLENPQEHTTLTCDEIDLGEVVITNDGTQVVAARDELAPDRNPHFAVFWNRSIGDSPVRVVQFEQPILFLELVKGEEPLVLIVSGRDQLECKADLYSIDGMLRQNLYTGKNGINSVAISRSRERVVWVDSGFHAESWLMGGPKPLQEWTTEFPQVREIRFSHDDLYLVGTGFTEDVYLITGGTGILQSKFEGYRPSQFPLYVLSVAAMLPLVGALTWYEKQKKRQRQSGVTRVAELLNWEMTTGQLPDSLPKFRFFSKRSGGHFEHILMGEGTSHAALLAVYAWTEQSGKNRVSRQELCIIFPNVAGDLPELMIQPETIIDRMAEWGGYQDIDLTGSDAQRDFSNAYVLRSVEPERMEDIIHDDLASFLCKQSGWNMEVKEGSVLMWWQRVESFTQPRFKADDSDKILAFRDEAEAVLELLLKD